jgi:4-aminobutyrate aminotransferase
MPTENTELPRIVVPPPGPKARRILEADARWITRSYSRQVPIVWDRAEDCAVYDVDGNAYIDFTSGIIVANVGHSHPRVVRAIQQQSARVTTCYDAVTNERRLLLEKLASLLPGEDWRMMLLTTGSETIEAAIKLARLHTGKHEIIGFHGGFHGRTYGSMSAGGSSGTKRGFGPLAPGFLHAPYGYCYRCAFGKEYPSCDLHCVKYLDWLIMAESSGDVAAVVTEPYLGGGGYVVPPPGYAEAIRAFCDRRGLLLIYDEVQSSFGRTGKMFAFENFNLVPDILCVAKGFTSSVPGSAMIARRTVMEALLPDSMSSTHGGNPLSCAAALASIEVLEEENLCERAQATGWYILQSFREMKESHPLIGDVRGLGMAIGVELVLDKITKEPAAEVAHDVTLRVFEKGLLMIPPKAVFDNVLRINPPLTIERDLVDKALKIIEEALSEAEEELGLKVT